MSTVLDFPSGPAPMDDVVGEGMPGLPQELLDMMGHTSGPQKASNTTVIKLPAFPGSGNQEGPTLTLTRTVDGQHSTSECAVTGFTPVLVEEYNAILDVLKHFTQ